MKKKIRLVICLIVFISAIIYGNSSFALSSNSSNYVMLYNKDIKRETGYYYVSSISQKLLPIYKLTKTNKHGNVQEKNAGNEVIYSLNNSYYEDLKNPVSYNQEFDLKDREELFKDGTYSNHLPKNEDTYSRLVWILDNVCIPEDDDSRLKFFNSIGIKESDFTLNNISMDTMIDIVDCVQQAAIWNYCSLNNSINNTAEFGYTDNEKSIYSIVDKFFPDTNKNNPVYKMYYYLINGANEAISNGYKYNTRPNTSAVSFDKSRAKAFTFNDNYYIGPYNFNLNTNANYSLSLKIFNNASEVGNAKLVFDDGITEINGLSTSEKIMNSQGRDFYIVIPTNSSAYNVSIVVDANTEVTSSKLLSPSANIAYKADPIVQVRKESIRFYESDAKTIQKPEFDLSLSSFVSTINNDSVTPSREPSATKVELQKLSSLNASLDNGTTASKKVNREKLEVEAGNKIVYTIRVYNEGDIDGTATEIAGYIPDGMEMIPASESDINAEYKWNTDVTKSVAVSSYLADKTIAKFDKFDTNKINYEDIKFECKVIGGTTSDDQFLKMIFEITGNSQNGNDRDSNTGNVKDRVKSYNPGTLSQANDCDIIMIKGRFFDLALREFVSKVNGGEIKSGDRYTREPNVNPEELKNGNETAEYKHTKKPYSVEINDVVTYTIRVYNEGQMDGYASEITMHLPEELELVNNEFNAKNGWIIDGADKTQRTIRTRFLSKEQDEDNIIKAFVPETGEISYKEIEIECRVKANSETQKEITNIVEITRSDNATGIVDRDNKMIANLPSDEDMSKYRANIAVYTPLDSNDYYYQGQEDDDDFEKIIIDKFDLALRVFAVRRNGADITGREPVIDKTNFGTVKDNRVNTTMNYNHPKDTIEVCNNDEIMMTIRVYNEGTKDGYVSLIRDNLSEGLEFIKENDTNQKYRWTMKDENGNNTDDVTKAKSVQTDYLSKSNETTEGENKIRMFDDSEMNVPEYKEVQIVLKIKEPQGENREVINRVEILEDKDTANEDVVDSDSVPGVWNEYEDDQDIEKFYVKKFDMAIKSWLHSTIVIDNGIEKETETKHTENDENEAVVKLNIDHEKENNVVIKFKYKIRVYNEGEIEGYVREITNYLPEGLSFNLADNIDWERSGENVVYRKIRNDIINPGGFKDLELVLTWDLDEKKTNTINSVIEISETYNKSETRDIDSTVKNKEINEDDIDYSTSEIELEKKVDRTYILIIAGVILLILIAIFFIRKIVIVK